MRNMHRKEQKRKYLQILCENVFNINNIGSLNIDFVIYELRLIWSSIRSTRRKLTFWHPAEQCQDCHNIYNE